MHVVSFNTDRYDTFDEAKTEEDGLAVIAALFHVGYCIYQAWKRVIVTRRPGEHVQCPIR